MYNYYRNRGSCQLEIKEIKFTLREIDILSCILHGRGSKKIAELLTISPKTAEAHIRNIMLKIDCNSRESVIDYLETSDQLRGLNLHYFSLIKSGLFVKHLSELRNVKERSILKCRLVYDPKNRSEALFFKMLESYLRMAGVTTEIEKPSKTLLELPDSHFTICSMATRAHLPDSLFSAFLILPGEADEKGLKTPTLDFRQEHEGIPSFFSLLRHFIPDLNVSKYISKLDISDKIDKRPPHEVPIKEETSQFEERKRFWLQDSKVIYGLSVGAVLLVSALYFVGVPYFKGNMSVRSELPIPNHAVLLERPRLVKQINEKLGKHSNEIRVIALVGIGGSGKSTLAKQFGRQHVSSVVWEINANSSSSIVRSFESLAYALAQTRVEKEELETINTLRESAERDRQLLYFVRRHLKAKGNWLLIYDNLENFSLVHDYFPHDKESWGEGLVLITTQNENLQNNSYLGNDNTIKVGHLNDDDKASLFQSILAEDSKSPLDFGTEKFLKHIPPFPLDVSICAYYLKNTDISPDLYLQYMEESGERFAAFQKQLLTDVSDYSKTRYSIVTLSLEKLLQTHPEFIKPLLLISLLGSQNIPSYLLARIQDDMAADTFIYNLKNFSLITTQPSPLETFSIHDSTQKLMLTYLEKHGFLEDNIHLLQSAASDFIDAMKEAGDTLDDTKLRALVPHAEEFLKHKDELPVSLVGLAYGQLGRVYYYLGHYEEAEPHLERGAEIMKSYYGTSHPHYAWVNTYLGKIHRNLGDYVKAETFLQRSFHVYKTRRKDFPLEYAWAAAHIGNIYRSLGEYKKGEEYLRSALAIYKEQLGEEHIKSAWASVHLANILRHTDKMGEAYRLVKSSYPIFRDHYGEDHPQTAWVHICLGRILLAMGDVEAAEAILQANLKTYKKYFGHDHIQTAWALRGNGRVFLAKGDLPKAKSYLEESLEILQKRNHPDAYISLEVLAQALMQDQSALPRSREYLQSAFDIVTAHFPLASPHRERLEDKLKKGEIAAHSSVVR